MYRFVYVLEFKLLIVTPRTLPAATAVYHEACPSLGKLSDF